MLGQMGHSLREMVQLEVFVITDPTKSVHKKDW